MAITDHLALLAEAQALDGKIDDALITIEEGPPCRSSSVGTSRITDRMLPVFAKSC